MFSPQDRLDSVFDDYDRRVHKDILTSVLVILTHYHGWDVYNTWADLVDDQAVTPAGDYWVWPVSSQPLTAVA